MGFQVRGCQTSDAAESREGVLGLERQTSAAPESRGKVPASVDLAIGLSWRVIGLLLRSREKVPARVDAGCGGR